MIISYRHKFIFVAIPKTASHSFRVALRPTLDVNDWEQCHLLVEKAFPIAPLADMQHGHFTCLEIKPYLIADLWDQYFKFCTVRNPYDRFISHCYFIHRKGQKMQKDPLSVMKRIMDKPDRRFNPQHFYITNTEGQLIVNHVAKFETLQTDFDHISSEIGLPKVHLQHINPAHRPDYNLCFDQELLEMVQAYYARDFELFDYSLALEH